MIARLHFAFQRRGQLTEHNAMTVLGLSRAATCSYLKYLEQRAEIERDGIYWRLKRKVRA